MIRLRAHHLLCIPKSHKKWYDKDFEKNFKGICNRVAENPLLKIKVVKKCDDICAKCPYRKGRICRKQEKINYWILAHDSRAFKALGIKKNSVYKAKDVLGLSIKRVGNKELKKICRGCEFLESCLKYGINKSFRKAILKEKYL